MAADRYGILGAQVSLRTDMAPIREFFSHAYRWFPPDSSGRDVDLAAILGGAGGEAAFVRAGDAWLDLGGSASPENRAFLFLLEAVMDAIDGSILLHGGAVSRAGEGIVLAGPTLAGKSTLVLELMKIGLDFLSDDAAPIERRSGLLLPFPRAVGVRKDGAEAALRRSSLPASGVHDLPHKWLVDPQALGARLPAQACRPAYLFYLEPETASGDPSPVRSFEVALADRFDEIRREVQALSPESLEEVQRRPFPTLVARFRRGSRPLSALSALWRRHRGSILFIEETRAPARRTQGAPIIEPVGVASLLMPLVRDVLNRGEGGRLLASHSGRLTSLMVELGTLLRDVRCFRVASATPAQTAAAITQVVDERGKHP